MKYDAAKLKVVRADRHVRELDSVVQTFFNTKPYSLRVDEEPQTGQYIMKFSAKPLPREAPLIVGDVIHNLRTALDLLMCEIVVDAGGNEAAGKFPFHETRENLADLISKGEIQKVAPHLVDFILDTIKPYRAGNFPLWALHKLDVMDKHKLLIPIIRVMRLTGVSAVDERHNTIEDLSVTVGGDGVLAPFATRTKLHITNHGQPSMAILFDEGQFFEGQPVFPTLHQLGELVTGTIRALEAFVSGQAST